MYTHIYQYCVWLWSHLEALEKSTWKKDPLRVFLGVLRLLFMTFLAFREKLLMSTPPSEEGLSKTENDQMGNYKWKVQKKGVESHKNKNKKLVGIEVNTEQSNHDSANCFLDTFEDRLLNLGGGMPRPVQLQCMNYTPILIWLDLLHIRLESVKEDKILEGHWLRTVLSFSFLWPCTILFFCFTELFCSRVRKAYERVH